MTDLNNLSTTPSLERWLANVHAELRHRLPGYTGAPSRPAALLTLVDGRRTHIDPTSDTVTTPNLRNL